MDEVKCMGPKCNKPGYMTFKGYPTKKYCIACYKMLSARLNRIDREMTRIRLQQKAEAEDHQPARIRAEQ
jgi:hypothetical protein